MGDEILYVKKSASCVKSASCPRRDLKLEVKLSPFKTRLETWMLTICAPSSFQTRTSFAKASKIFGLLHRATMVNQSKLSPFETHLGKIQGYFSLICSDSKERDIPAVGDFQRNYATRLIGILSYKGYKHWRTMSKLEPLWLRFAKGKLIGIVTLITYISQFAIGMLQA